MRTENITLMITNSLTDSEGYVIGKASKRYTLWSYQYEVEGNSRMLKLHYIHNLSSDRNKVLQRWPNTTIWESLRGATSYSLTVPSSSHSSSSTPSEVKPPKTWMDFDIIPFGKYKGTSIKDVTDCGYWCWMANKTQEGDYMTIDGEDVYFKPLFEKMAQETGGQKMFGKWMSNEDTPYLNNVRNIYKAVQTGEPFSFIADKNDCSFFYGCPIIFKPEDTYSFYTYYGGGRFLVVTDKKGNRKNKRTNGKTIEITSYKYIKDDNDERGRIEVESFNIK